MNFDIDFASIAVLLAINLILFGMPLAVGIGIAFRMTRDSSPRTRYIIAVIAFFIAAFYPIWATFNTSGQHQETMTAITDTSAVNNENLHSSRQILAETENPEIEKPTKQNDTLNINFRGIIDSIVESGVGTVFLFLWLFVGACLIVRDVVGHLRLRRARHKWKLAPQTLCQKLEWNNSVPLLIDGQKGPGTVGFLRPVVVIPSRLFSDITLEAARHITRHELSHARWRDPLVHTLVRLIRAALWISPPLWFLEKIIRIEREVAADRDAISSVQSPAENSDLAVAYANSLLQIAYQLKSKTRQYNYDLMTTDFVQKNGLEARVKRLFMPISRPSYIRLLFSFLVIVTSISGAASLSLQKLPLKADEPTLIENQPKEISNDSYLKEETTIGSTLRKEVQKKQETRITTDAPKQEPDIEQNFVKNVVSKSDSVINEKILNSEVQTKSERNPFTAVKFEEQSKSEQLPEARSFREEMATVGFTNLSDGQLRMLKAYDVDLNYIKGLRRLGFNNITPEQLVGLRVRSIKPEFIRQIQIAGFNNITPEELISLQVRNIEPEFIRQMQSAGFTDLSVTDLIQLTFHKVTLDYINLLKAEGFHTTSTVDIIQLKVAGITPDFVRSVKAKGFTNITASRLVGLHFYGSVK